MPARILVIDDDVGNIQILRLRLEANGYEVLSATAGVEGVRRAICERPDVILLDVMMPGMDGFEVCHELKQHKQTKTIPILMVTGLDREAAVNRGLAEGAVCFISRPYHPDDLIGEIRSILPHAA